MLIVSEDLAKSLDERRKAIHGSEAFARARTMPGFSALAETRWRPDPSPAEPAAKAPAPAKQKSG